MDFRIVRIDPSCGISMDAARAEQFGLWKRTYSKIVSKYNNKLILNVLRDSRRPLMMARCMGIAGELIPGMGSSQV